MHIDPTFRSRRSNVLARRGMVATSQPLAAMAGLDSSDVAIGGYASSERQTHGPAVWAERTLERMPRGKRITACHKPYWAITTPTSARSVVLVLA